MPVLSDAERHALAMRLVGDFEARRFHVELSHAVLGGGGTDRGPRAPRSRVRRRPDRSCAPAAWSRGARRRPASRSCRPTARCACRAGTSARCGRRSRCWRASPTRTGPAFSFTLPARPAAGGRGALGGVALRDRGAAPAAPAPRRARARRAAALPRDAARPGPPGPVATGVSSGVHPKAAVGFDRAAGAYERGRAGYPAPADRSDPGRDGRRARRTLLELGAGTGKLTRELVGSGARVIALEPVAGMRALLADTAPQAEPLDAVAEAIPLADASVDAVVAASVLPLVRSGGGRGRGRARAAPGRRRRPDLEPPRRERRLDARVHAHRRAHAGDAPRYKHGTWRRASTAIRPSRRSSCAPGRTAARPGATWCSRARPP